MKQRTLFTNSCLIAVGALLVQARSVPAQDPSTAPPPVYVAPNAAPSSGAVYVYDQKPVATGGQNRAAYLISPEQAQSIITRFKEAYAKMGAPRLLIYVNRDLIDNASGLKLSSHKKVIETTRVLTNKDGSNPGAERPDLALPQTERVVSTNIYRAREPKETSLADKQTRRDVERLLGRPLRMAGAHLADLTVAGQVLSGKRLDSFSIEPDGEQARKDRESLGKIADVVLEVLISSKDVTVAEGSGDRTYTAPDLQVTAIRLSDSKILGQATAADLIGQGASAGKAAHTYGIREIAEATALSLMEDMMLP